MGMRSKVLVVDDEPRNQKIIGEILEDQVDLHFCATGEEALAAAQSLIPDLILLDIMMPGISGLEVCKQLKSMDSLKFCKVILVSGKALIEERLEGYAYGADDYLTKPFVPEELLAKVKVFLRLTRLETSLEEIAQARSQQLLDVEGKLIGASRLSALGEMAGGIAHEINTPLANIALLADQINQIADDPQVNCEELKILSANIENTVARIGKIIQGLRFFSRDGSKDHKDGVSIKKLLDDTLTLCSEKLKHNQIELRLKDLSEVQVHCRGVQISQILLNLLSNACDAVSCYPEKWIEISLVQSPQFLELVVTDSGNGISENVRAKLFQPFFTTKGVGKGTGLGLSISKGIAEAHGGTLTFDQNCRNTRFILKLPRKVGGSKNEAVA